MSIRASILIGVIALASALSGCGQLRLMPATCAVVETGHFDSAGKLADGRRETSATGPGLSGPVGKVTVKDMPAPKIDLAELIVTGGGMEGLSLSAPRANPLMALYAVGGLAMLAGVVALVWLKAWGVGLGLLAGGAALLGCATLVDRYPWVCLAVAGALLLAGAIWLLLGTRRGRDLWQSLLAVVPAVQAAEPQNRPGPVKGAIANASADAGCADAVKRTIRKAKRKTNLI